MHASVMARTKSLAVKECVRERVSRSREPFRRKIFCFMRGDARVGPTSRLVRFVRMWIGIVMGNGGGWGTYRIKQGRMEV